MMNKPIEVKIIGSPVACSEGVKELWRDVASWAAGQLQTRYGDQVITRYFDLFDPECPTFPAESQLPVVFVEEKLVSSGGKISIPLIRQEIESLLQVQ
jgi:disulfide oxidoreductase YuzD